MPAVPKDPIFTKFSIGRGHTTPKARKKGRKLSAEPETQAGMF